MINILADQRKEIEAAVSKFQELFLSDLSAVSTRVQVGNHYEDEKEYYRGELEALCRVLGYAEESGLI